VIGPTLKVVRILLTSWFWALLFPITILLVSAAVNTAVWAAVGKEEVLGAWTGGLITIYIVQLTVTWAGLSQHASFAVGPNATRPACYAGCPGANEGRLTRSTLGELDEAGRVAVADLGLTLEPASRQQAIVSLTAAASAKGKEQR
jgi:hypothetical protein